MTWCVTDRTGAQFTQVFDNGLLGEGVLQVLAGLHRQGAVGPHTTLIPCSAQLFCQPIQLLQGSTEDDGMDLAPWSVFESSEGYVGLDLAPISHQAGEYHSIVHSPAGAWRPLAQPARAFCFDFYSTAHKSPEQHSLSLVCHTSGKVNAVAFWFTLDLCKDDGHRSVIQLSTDPLKNSPGSRTWQVKQDAQIATTARATQGTIFHFLLAFVWQLRTTGPSQQTLQWFEEYCVTRCATY